MARRSSTTVLVALVGREQPGDENLALRYLAAALAEAGHRPLLVPLVGPEHLDGAVRTILARAPALVGVSMPDADIAVDALAFVRLLRRHGYGGHVTAGGALATLVRREILAKHPGIDSVVRHDGEIPVVELADRLGEGRAWHDVPGLTTRQGDGSPAPVASAKPLGLRPLRPRKLPRILGVPAARMLASRGCPGRCPYCGPAALQREAVKEGLRGGTDRETLTRRGVGGTRRREPRDVADEVADLHHEKGARLFHLLDDNLLSGEPGAAAEWLRALVGEMEVRGVGRTAWSLQMDPFLLGEEVASALEDLGVIRVLLGVEALTPAGLRSLGRRGDAARNGAAIRALERRGIVTLFNSLLVHPDATFESISSEIDALSAQRGIHFDALAMAVYPGTDAWHRLCQTGEVSGGMLGLRFEPRDPVVARFRAALVRLRLQATGRYGANVFAHDVSVNLAMARRLGLPAYDPALEAPLRAAVDEIGQSRVRSWRRALALASAEMSSGDRARAVLALCAELSAELGRATEEVARIQRRLERGARVKAGARNLLVHSALAAGFTLLLAPSHGCGSGGSRARGGQDAGDAGGYDAGRDAALDASSDAGRDASSDAGEDAASDAGEDAATDGGGDASADAATDGGCGPDEVNRELSLARDAMDRSGCQDCFEMKIPYGIFIDEEGRVVDVRRQDGGAVPDDVRDCYLDALAGESFPCLAGDEVWQECVICLF